MTTVGSDNYDVGVIVGRFQVHRLTGGHLALIDRVKVRHPKVIVVLGNSPIPNSTANPLDFEARKQMLQTAYPSLIVLPLDDVASDEVWSANLDRLVASVSSPRHSTLLYGSRDSFIPYYSGRLPCYEIAEAGHFNATEVRARIRREVLNSEDFRAGMIYASADRFPTCFPTVDVAIFTPGYEEILLGRKPNDARWRLPGGFADPGSRTYEEDAAREAFEETHLVVDAVAYLESKLIDDWRYRGEPDCVKTLLFAGYTPRPETATAGDDLAEVRWWRTLDIEDPGPQIPPYELPPPLHPYHESMIQSALRYAKAMVMQRA